MSRLAEVLDRLAATIEARKGADPSVSYTAQLLASRPKCVKKLREEALETVDAARKQDRDAIAAESGDLIYHWLVMLVAHGVSTDEVAKKLEAREGTSGLTEKAQRPRKRII